MQVNSSVDSAAAEKWFDHCPQLVKSAVGKAMASEAKQLRSAIRAHVASRISVLRKGFLNNFQVALRDKGNDLTSLKVYSKGRWAGIHNFGVTIGGKMLIPINERLAASSSKPTSKN
jgi:hypothetical protein